MRIGLNDIVSRGHGYFLVSKYLKPLTQVHVGGIRVTTLKYETGENSYLIPDINLETSQIIMNKTQGKVQLAEVEVYGKFCPGEFTISTIFHD